MNPRGPLLWLALSAVLILTAVCYSPGISGPFLLDDAANIAPARVKSLHWDDWVLAITSNYSGRLGRPVAAASFAITSYFYGLKPLPFKIGNLGLHLLCGVLLFILARQLLRNLPHAPSSRQIWLIAILAATLWLLHPLHVSTTLYVVQRMAQLSMLFVLIALCSYAFLRPQLHKRPWRVLFIMCAAIGMAGLLGVLSKEDAALLPAYLLLVETTVFGWRTQSPPARRSLLIFQSIFVLFPLTLAIVYISTHFPDLTRGYTGRNFTLVERLLTESRALWFYLRLILVPDISQMTLFHDGYPIQRSLDWITLAGLLGHAALLGSAALFVRKAPVYALGVGLFYTAHLLESTFIPLEPVFEHRNYLASWGPLLALSYYGVRAVSRERARFAATRLGVLFAVLLSLLAYSTYARSDIWSHTNEIYVHALENHPESIRAHVNYASHFFHQGDFKEGRILLIRALRRTYSDDIGPALQLFNTYCTSGLFPADLYMEVRRRMELGPANAYARNSLYKLIQLRGNGQCPEISAMGLTELARAFLANPSNSYGMARYYTLMHYARALSLDGRHQETILLLRLAETMRDRVPNIAKPVALQGVVLQSLRMGDVHAAREAVAGLARITSDPRIPARPKIRPYLRKFRSMRFAERYGLVNLSEYRVAGKLERSPKPEDLSPW